MPFGDLAQALAMQAISLDGCLIQFQRSAADALAFEADAPHAGAHPLDDQITLQLGYGADDDDDSPSQRAGGIDVLSEADIFDVEPVEFVQNIEEVLDRPSQPVRSPDQNNVELAAAGIAHHLIKSWTPGLGSGDPIRELGDDLKTALGCHLAQVQQLGLWMLIEGADPHVERGALHERRPFDFDAADLLLAT